MDEGHLERQLRIEGFAHIYAWQDRPDAYYPEHTHPVETAHLILEGEMTLMMDGQTYTFSAGERCDVPAGAMHSARIGPRGCRYPVGEKHLPRD